ncbi:hypothetical protein UA44_24995, partial [Klebsiella aerogenes]
ARASSPAANHTSLGRQLRSSPPSWSTSRSSAKVAKEETFGPLAPLFRFKDEADVIAQPTIPNSASPPISTPAT